MFKYTVEINEDITIKGVSKRVATKTANLHANEGDTVFVKWYRESDGKRGYLNRTGFGIVGLRW